MKYKLGDLSHPSIFTGLDISDVTHLNIAVFGPTGSGKSCFINSCERTLNQSGRGTCKPQASGGEGTVTLEAYLQQYFFHLLDTRGLFSYSNTEIEEFMLILSGKFRDGDLLEREDDFSTEDTVKSLHTQKRKARVNFTDRIHGAILIIKADDPRLRDDKMAQYLKLPRNFLRNTGISVVTLVTHADKLDENGKQLALDLASKATGSPINQTFLISNYIVDDCEPNPDTEAQVIRVLQYVLVSAERFVKLSKQRAKNELENSVGSSQ